MNPLWLLLIVPVTALAAIGAYVLYCWYRVFDDWRNYK
jgi:hypothetical protein